MSHQYNIRLAHELGYYQGKCDTLQAALASVLRVTGMECEYFQTLADMDLEEEKARVIERLEVLYE